MICRLCSKYNEDVLHFFDSAGLEMGIVSIVAKYFWFEPKLEDNASHIICVSCWTTTKNFHELYLLVENVEKYWTEKWASIKKDPNEMLESDFENDAPISKIGDLKKGSSEENSDDEIKQLSFEEPELVHVANEDTIEKRTCISEDVDTEIKENISMKDQSVPKCEKTRRKSTRKLKNNGDSIYQSQTEVNRVKKKDKTKTLKRTPEETCAFNKKIAEGDALIAKFMKIYCNVCSEEQANFTALKHHCTSCHAQQGIVMCCGRKFDRKSKLVEHIEKHIDPEKHKCHICDHVSANRWNLKIHMESIHKQEKDKIKPFKCSYCSKTFKLQAQLIRHELIHLPEEERKFKCSYCNKNFPSESSLKYHIRLCHEGYYSGVCDICGKAYNNRQDLKRHRLQVHEGVERSTYKCKYCYMEFTSKYTYNIHKFREHENQNPNIDYKCTICNKISANSEALKNHIQYVHRAKAKFECTLCKKVFKRELALKEHMAAHIGQSLYSCPHCSKTFTHSSNMHHHRKLKHPTEFESARKVKDNKKETWREFTSLNV